MHLHYYYKEKYVGLVDIEIYMASKNRSVLVANDQAGDDLLGALELVYGKTIGRMDSESIYRLRKGIPMTGHTGNWPFPDHVYLTKKAGKQLTWLDQEKRLG